MKTYAVALKKHPERYDHIKGHLQDRGLDFEVVQAVDGSLLTDSEKEELCDMSIVNNARWWLTDGALGAALSHYKCLDKIARSNDRAGFIVEDDVLLPENISNVLSDIEGEVQEDEVVLLFYTFSRPTGISSSGRTDLGTGALLYPMELRSVMSAVAYVVGRKAAQGLVDVIKPIKVPADCWYRFHEQKAFSSLRIFYPGSVQVTHIKSSIDYISKGSLKSRLSHFINNNRIPFIYGYLKRARKKRLDRIMNNFYLVDEVSPLESKR